MEFHEKKYYVQLAILILQIINMKELIPLCDKQACTGMSEHPHDYTMGTHNSPDPTKGVTTPLLEYNGPFTAINV